MTSILLAFQFLTILPFKVKRFNADALAWAAVFFPIVGLALGLILAGVNYLLVSYGFNDIASNIVLVILLVILTGGLHLDGLSDTSDALFSGKPKDEMLAIMRDSHVGVMGVLAIISVLLLKVAFLSAIAPELKSKALILMCVLSRWSMPLSIYSLPYARQNGKAKSFMDGMNIWIFLTASLIALVITYFLLGVLGISILGATAAAAYFTGLYIKGKVGGITGDTIGAVSELSEVVILIGFIIVERSFF